MNASTGTTSVIEKIKRTTSNITVGAVMLVVSFLLISLIVYVFVEYAFFNKKLNHIAPIVENEYKYIIRPEDSKPYITEINKAQQDVKMSKDTKYVLMTLLKAAVNALKNNSSAFTQLDFYAQPIEELLNRNDWYKPVLKLSKFCYLTPTVTNQGIDECLEEMYGSLQSKELFVNVNGIDYYIPLEFDPAMQIYLANKEYLDKLIVV
jgi:uncharacterized protein YneF (UPF0154 family)